MPYVNVFFTKTLINFLSQLTKVMTCSVLYHHDIIHNYKLYSLLQHFAHSGIYFWDDLVLLLERWYGEEAVLRHSSE